MTTPKVMKLVDPSKGLMKCRFCGAERTAILNPDGKFRRGSWQCKNCCRDVVAEVKQAKTRVKEEERLIQEWEEEKRAIKVRLAIIERGQEGATQRIQHYCSYYLDLIGKGGLVIPQKNG